MIKVLDCTLRDGGYINDWRFSSECIINLINKLSRSHIDILEIGFLDDTKDEYSSDYTVFENIINANSYLEQSGINSKTSYVLMVMHGKYNIPDLPDAKKSLVNGIRYCFKKEYINDAIDNCRKIIEKGYDVYLQPAALSDYNDEEILYLIRKANEIRLHAFYIVDTFGVMRLNDVMRYFYLIDYNLKKDVPIGFHSHNNLQLSFSNSQSLINIVTKRDLYIDSSVFGMGRGAGNLCTELITQFINENIENRYDLIPILELMDEYILPIYNKQPWGYSAPYYIAAINMCHPNYATYLMNLQTLSIRDINTIIKSIPEKFRNVYDKEIIRSLYLKYQQHSINDAATLKYISDICNNKKVLILAPGKSLQTMKREIWQYINENSPIIFSINHIPKYHKYDMLFISNLKRFSEIDDAKLVKAKVLFTSNITTDTSLHVVNYSSYINNDDAITDNSGLMLINILKKIGVSAIALAGYDGFSLTSSQNYYDETMVNSIQYEKQLLINRAIKAYFNKAKKSMNIEFITPTIYDKGDINE